MIRAGGFSRKLLSINLSSLFEVSVTNKSDGAGTLSLGRRVPARVALQSFGAPQRPEFEAIADVRAVLEIIRTAQNNWPAGSDFAGDFTAGSL